MRKYILICRKDLWIWEISLEVIAFAGEGRENSFFKQHLSLRC